MEFNQLQTPCYIINEKDYRANIEEFEHEFRTRWEGNVLFGYSVKTNHYPYLMKVAKTYGWYAETVSVTEYLHSKSLGFAGDKMILNGPQKKEWLIPAAVDGGIVNLDNMLEVEQMCNHLPAEHRDSVRIGLRVNFDLEKVCPGETTCGTETTRFGICYENGDIERAIKKLRAAGIKISGLHMHASTSSRSTRIYETLANMAGEVARKYQLDLDFVDIGGGYFGGKFFAGKPTVEEYANTITENLKKYFKPEQVTLILEPGAGVLATASDYLTAVLNIKDMRGTRIVTMDGTCLHINHFMKKQQTPCTLINAGEETETEQVLGGNTCMEMDRFYLRDKKNEILEDTKILFHCTGAYTMTHNGCFINTLPNIYVKKDDDVYELLREEDYHYMAL